jgi:hypothetical protein
MAVNSPIPVASDLKPVGIVSDTLKQASAKQIKDVLVMEAYADSHCRGVYH